MCGCGCDNGAAATSPFNSGANFTPVPIQPALVNQPCRRFPVLLIFVVAIIIGLLLSRR